MWFIEWFSSLVCRFRKVTSWWLIPNVEFRGGDGDLNHIAFRVIHPDHDIPMSMLAVYGFPDDRNKFTLGG